MSCKYIMWRVDIAWVWQCNHDGSWNSPLVLFLVCRCCCSSLGLFHWTVILTQDCGGHCQHHHHHHHHDRGGVGGFYRCRPLLSGHAKESIRADEWPPHTMNGVEATAKAPVKRNPGMGPPCMHPHRGVQNTHLYTVPTFKCSLQH